MPIEKDGCHQLLPFCQTNSLPFTWETPPMETKEIKSPAISLIKINSSLQIEILKTYIDWPQNALYKNTILLSNSGLYYTGVGDIVRCVKCHKLFYEWVETDDPHMTHLNFSPECKNIENKEVLLPHYENMLCWINRCKTFDLWPLDFINRDALSQAGFFYTNVSDFVKCFACKIVIGNWDTTDDPLEKHKNGPWKCEYIKNAEIISKDNFDFDITDGEYSSNFNSGPYHPEYATLPKRLETFNSFPRSIKPNATDLAEAGFFYTNVGDKVKCYYCDGVLMHWEPSDNPWKEHSRWFPDCNFVRVMKGDTLMRNNTINKNINVNLTKIKTCRICDKEKPTELSVPCGHLAACSGCSKNLRNCACCYSKFQNIVHVFQ